MRSVLGVTLEGDEGVGGLAVKKKEGTQATVDCTGVSTQI